MRISRKGKSVSRVYIFLMTACFIVFPACQQLCQQPPTTAFTTFTGQQWRLASTTDPTVKNLTNTNFETITFNANYTGAVYKVQNNELFNNPALIFAYNVDPNSQQIEVQFSAPPTTDGSGDGSDPSVGQVGQTQTFQYTLTTSFTMTDVATGWTYNWVPFEGIVLPDQQCTFPTQ